MTRASPVVDRGAPTRSSLPPLALAVSLALAACGSGAEANDNETGGASGATTAAAVVTTDGFTFSPAHVTVPLGAKVRWQNPSSVPHTVTSGLSSRAEDAPGTAFDAPLGSGASFEFTFKTAGDQPYFCRYHEGMGMTGVVTVTP